jgi:hypothetical protein
MLQTEEWHMKQIVAKKILDGVYRLEYGGVTVDAVRQPDLYFVISLDGKEHKGYLKQLKDILQRHVDGDAPGPQPEPPVAHEEEGIREQHTPQVGTAGELVAENDKFEIRVHMANIRFPSSEGYAIINKATREQRGWVRDRSRALELLASQS